MKNTIILFALFLPVLAFSQTPAYIDTGGVKNKVKWNSDIRDSLRVQHNLMSGDVRVSSTFAPWYVERKETQRLSTMPVSILVVQFNCGEKAGEILETFTHNGWTYSLSSTGWRKTKNI